MAGSSPIRPARRSKRRARSAEPELPLGRGSRGGILPAGAGFGRIDLPDGSQLRVGYDGQNGWPYVAIGRVMIERGLIDRESATSRGSAPGSRAYLAEAKDILDANPSYVFFREIAGEGPVGSEGIALTPGRSLAVDTKLVPLGAPFWLDAERR